MELVKFKNGNINIKLENHDMIKSYYHAIETICNELDFCTLEDTEQTQHNEYCLGNDCIAYDLYHNGDDGIVYMFSSYDCEKLLQGKTIKLYATKNNDIYNESEWV